MNACIFSAVPVMMRCLLSFGAHDMCGVIRQFGAVFRDEELRAYFGIALCSALLITWNVRGQYGSLGETFRHAAFQVSSIMTTTGFATVDFAIRSPWW